MSTTDLGESLVGAYVRHVERCTMADALERDG